MVRGNLIWANTDEDPGESEGHGIIMDTCGAEGSALIENNVIWDNEGWCIAILNSDGATIRNNTCWMNGLGRFDGTGELSLRGAVADVHNNIFVSRGNGPAMTIYDTGNLPSVSAGYNILWSPATTGVVIWPPWNVDTVADYQQSNPYGWGVGSLQLDPQLVDPSGKDFQISSSSPAADTGLDAEGATTDISGFTRPLDSDGDGIPHVDRGAYEHAGIFLGTFETGDTSRWSLAIP